METKFVAENLIMWISSNAKFIKDQNSPPNPLQNSKRIFGSTNFPLSCIAAIQFPHKVTTTCNLQ